MAPTKFDNRCKKIKKKGKMIIVRKRYRLTPSRDTNDKNYGIWLDQMHTWPHPNKSVSLRCYLPLVIIPMQKSRDISWFFSLILLIKESCNLIGQETHWLQTTKSDSPRCYHPLMINSMKNSINWLFPKKFMIKESCHLIGQKLNWPQSTKSDSLRCYLPLMIISMQKI